MLTYFFFFSPTSNSLNPPTPSPVSKPQRSMCPFLNMANDILQTGKRKGNDFFNKLWKVFHPLSYVFMQVLGQEKFYFGSRS